MMSNSPIRSKCLRLLVSNVRPWCIAVEADQKVEVVEAGPGGPEPTAFRGEDPANGIVQRHDLFNIIKETLAGPASASCLVHSAQAFPS